MGIETQNPVDRYEGIDIFQDDDGFFASHGISEHFGYHDTIEAIKAEIDDYWRGDQHGPLNGFHYGEE